MSPAEPATVLIVEDHVHTARRLHGAVDGHPGLRVVGETHLVERALHLIDTLRPRILLTDLGLPDGSGVELIRHAKAAPWPCDSLVVSVFGDEQRVIAALRAGARGYILKAASAPDIGESVASILDGGAPMSPQIARHLLDLVGSVQDAPGAAAADIVLTPREREVLGAVARGYKRHEIAERLSISVGTVGNHINAIYRKLEVGSNIEAVVHATRIGLL